MSLTNNKKIPDTKLQQQIFIKKNYTFFFIIIKNQ